MQIDAPDLVKWLASAFTAGGGFAVVRPFAVKLFDNYLERSKARALIAERKETALERIAGQNERFIGVLERIDDTLGKLRENVDARLDRLEAHMGITPSKPPPLADPPREPTRRQLTDPDLRAVVLPGELSAPAGGPAR